MMTSTIVETTRFGEIEYSNEDVLSFPAGLVGFHDLKELVSIPHGADSPFVWLQSTVKPEIAFLVVDPAAFVKNYAPMLRDEDAQVLELQESTPRVVYTIVNIPPGRPEEMTLNLAGPIVVNVEKRLAAQIVLEDEIYELRHKVQLYERSSAA